MTTRLQLSAWALAVTALLTGCASQSTLPSAAKPAAPAPAVPAPATPVPVALETVLQKQIYQMSPAEAGRYVAWQHEAEPDLRKRIAAERNIKLLD